MKKLLLLLLFIMLLVGCSSNEVSTEVYNDTRQLHTELNADYITNQASSEELNELFAKYEEKYNSVKGNEKVLVENLLNAKRYYELMRSEESNLESESIEDMEGFMEANSKVSEMLKEVRDKHEGEE
jgi:uncharacterized protein YxeA